MPHRDPVEAARYLREWRQGLRRGVRPNTHLRLLLAMMVAGSPGDCWIWPKARRGRKPHFYGAIKIRGRHHATHRLAYELVNGSIPEGLTLDHLCRTPLCFNPAHLEPVTHKENCRRAHEIHGPHCARGHDFTPDNTYVDRLGGRHCMTCNRLAKKRRRSAERERRACKREALSPTEGKAS